MGLREAIRRWYKGELIVRQDPAPSGFRQMRGEWRRDWTSASVHWLVDFHRKHWKWIWGILAILASPFIAYLLGL